MEPTQGYVILNARKGLKDPVKNPMKTVTGYFDPLWMTQGRTVQGGPGTGAGVTCSGDRHWILRYAQDDGMQPSPLRRPRWRDAVAPIPRLGGRG